MAASLSSVALSSFPPSCQHDHRANAITLKCSLKTAKPSDPLHICRVLPKAPSDPGLFDEGRLQREGYGGLADLDGDGGARPDVRLPERRLSDGWREIHGQDDWAGMLDPMDPLLRSELIRYGEMAQACYDAFDFDPFSKYCGSCRYAKREFFERLDMKGRAGYDVTRYLYATSNINLPNFFKKSRWPKVWSKHANWIGYVAVSDDETTRRLGRRDIAIAWRGTVTRLEWVADLMDYLVPVSSQKVPCPDPGVKAESGFLCLYTDKEDDCKFTKYSAR